MHTNKQEIIDLVIKTDFTDSQLDTLIVLLTKLLQKQNK